MKDICVILNGRSGSVKDPELEGKIRRTCEVHGRVDLFKPNSGEDMERALREAKSKDYELIVAGGGDGTVNAVVSIVAGGQSTLGVLPLGTLNHFAKDLRIPLDVDSALNNLFTGRVLSVDVGEVNGKVFVNNSSLGLYPEIVQLREAEQKRGRSKWTAFAEATVVALKRHPFMKVTLLVDDKEITRKTSFIFIGNNAYKITGVEAGSRASLTEGKLSLYVTHKQSRLGLIRLALKTLTGLLDRRRDLDCMTPCDVTIRMHHNSVEVATDGEVSRFETPLHYRIRPQALKVMAPVVGER